jgi:hypothetical protein
LIKVPADAHEARLKSLEMANILLKSNIRSNQDAIKELHEEFDTVKEEFVSVKTRFELGMSSIEGGIKRQYKIANEQKIENKELTKRQSGNSLKMFSVLKAVNYLNEIVSVLTEAQRIDISLQQ